MPGGGLFAEVVQREGCFQVVMDEPPIEVGKAEESLYILDLPWFRPILDHGYLGGVHVQSFGGQDESEVFHCVCVELALLKVSIQSCSVQAMQNFTDVVLMVLQGV